MQLKTINIDKKQKKLEFSCRNVSPVFMNTMRRLILEEVPTMAIATVEFRKNTSVLYDEVIAHRLGLIPLKTDLKSYSLPEKCKCEGAGCAKCTLKLTLLAKKDGMVLSDKLKSADPKVVPVYETTPIVNLISEQRLHLEATARLGKGKEHSKFSPGYMHYRQAVQINIAKRVSNPELIARQCPKKIFEVKGGELKIIKENVDNCHICDACVDAADGSIKLEYLPDEYFVTVESFGQLSPKEMLSQASAVFEEKLEEFLQKTELIDEQN